MSNNLTALIKKKSGSKSTRKELMKSSPIPWVILLVITLLVAGFFIWPDFSTWTEQRANTKSMETSIPTLEREKQNLTREKDVLTLSFKEKSEPFSKLADQRFPTLIDETKIAQILEMYAILMKVNYRSSVLELNSLSIGTPKNVDGKNYAKTTVNLNLLVDRNTLKEVIRFLKTSEITNELKNKVIASGGGETASIEFLTLSKLPVGRINSVSLNEEVRIQESGSTNIYNAQIQVLFYSELF